MGYRRFKCIQEHRIWEEAYERLLKQAQKEVKNNGN